MWSPALARGLIRHDVVRSIRYCEGIPTSRPELPDRRTLAQRAMHSPTVAAIYERFWRPVTVAIIGYRDFDLRSSVERASDALHLVGDRRVLDMACGPGNFTSFFAGQLDGDGFVIGLDNSLGMIERAVTTTARPVRSTCAPTRSAPLRRWRIRRRVLLAPASGGGADRRARRDGAGTCAAAGKLR